MMYLVSMNGGVLKVSQIPHPTIPDKIYQILWIISSNLGLINCSHSAPQVCSSSMDIAPSLKIPEPLGPDTDFQYRFTFFCLLTYSVQNLKVVGANSLSDFQQKALNRSVAAAANFCKFTLELGPATRDAARYMADFGFAMISFACIFIIQACENFYTSITGATEYLSDVEAVAQMLKEFAVNSNHGPSSQARIIIAKLQKMSESADIMAAGDPNSRPEDETTNEQFGLDVGDVEGIMNDPLWDTLDFFPDIPVM
jgi:hypothetical protein